MYGQTETDDHIDEKVLLKWLAKYRGAIEPFAPLGSSGPGTKAKVTKVRYKTKYLHLLVAYVSY